MPTLNQATSLPEANVWFEKYRPIENTHESASWEYEDGKQYLFNAYGEDGSFLANANENNIWSFVDGEDGTYIIPGYHRLDCIGYFVTEVPFANPNEAYVDMLYFDCDQLAA